MDTDLYLIRHAQSFANVEPIVGGMKGDAGLTPLGRQQAARLESRLRAGGIQAQHLYASTLPRALQTAEYVSRALGLPITPDDELQELRVGEADALSSEEYRARYPRPGDQSFSGDFFDPFGPGFPSHPFAPGGESWETHLERAGAALTRLVQSHPGDTVVAVTHGGNLRVAFFLAFGLAAAQGNRMRFLPTNTGMSHWRYHHASPDRLASWTIISFNDAAHLDVSWDHHEPLITGPSGER